MNLVRWIFDRVGQSVLARLIALAVAVLTVYVCTLLMVVRGGGTVSAVALSLAAGVSLLSSAAALVLSHWLRDPASGASAILLPMMVRTGLPLLLALIVRIRGQGLVEAGFVYYLVGFYVLALAVELPMSLPPKQRSLPYSEPSNRTDGGLHG